ncbi:uncharacterized protein TRAVEDRAFT_109933 [Trametes versicolor FP-101664 SS1]|uniref:uncharacterized protein n=1 Tax=Trametes versicolor (strain FP-101664) TaxID=717944 RepID=UPI00046223E0|nr:uncharacterized protein TRAVEDRAFT_109933 [Trametes versicolor FP-101664 SS1]EIW64518.1 hypothetical protein TRAVEDRAFT_109933 [Trametes versicolor FP-101664 SS1]
MSLPSNDNDAWFYPGTGFEPNDEDLPHSSFRGNWGIKTYNEAKWVRKGKMTAWAPWMEDWESEDRARKRIRMLLPSPEEEEDPPLTLPHLRSPSPPLMAPYPNPQVHHLSFTSLVMDKAATHSFRSDVYDELEDSTNTLVEGETSLRMALGRLWQVMSEDPDEVGVGTSLVPKREDEDDEDTEAENRFARAPDLTPVVHKLFLSPHREPIFEGAQFSRAEMQLETLEKSLATLRELQDDGREYVERLEEIREGLGEVRTQRNGVWDLVRKKAIQELQDVASAAAVS